MAFLASLRAKATEQQGERHRRLNLSAAQQLVAAQEADGHFDARTLGFKLARVWEKFLPASPMPDGDDEADGGRLCSAPATGALSGDPGDATAFVVRLFEHFKDKSGAEENVAAAWFGSGGVHRNGEWLVAAEQWLASTTSDWRTARSAAVARVVEAWFDTEADCRHRGTFVNEARRQDHQAKLGAKFAASRRAADARGEAWLRCTPADIASVPWETAEAVGWILGGEGGAYPVRVGAAEKLLIKRCVDVGDVVADALVKLVVGEGAGMAPLRFIGQGSDEYGEAERALLSAAPDEPEIGQRLRLALGRSRRDGHPLMVMAFVDGGSLAALEGSRVLRDGAATHMAMLGRTIALDCLMNNWDRFPALPMWPRHGNLGNVLVTRDEEGAHGLVCIDQAATLLTEETDRLAYYRALRTFAEEVAAVRAVGGGMERIKQAVRSSVPLWTGDAEADAKIYERQSIHPDSVAGVELDDVACARLLEGVSEVFGRAEEVRMAFAARREALSASCRALFVQVDAELSAKFAHRVEALLDFVDACLGVVAGHLVARPSTDSKQCT
jgi:hypothetical protein